MLLWWNAPFSYYITSKQFLLDVAHGLGTLGPACAVLARGLRENTTLFSEKGRQPDFSFNSYGPCAGLARCLRLGADLPNPGGAPPLNEEVKAYNAAKRQRLSKCSY